MKDLDLRIGKVLQLRNDLVVGKEYPYSDDDNDFEIFTEDMKQGKLVMIFDVVYNDNGNPAFIVDDTKCLYTLSMFDV